MRLLVNRLPVFVAVTLVGGTAIALPWSWSEYTVLPSQPQQAIQRLQIRGQHGVALYDSVHAWLTDDGGETWGSPINLKSAVGLRTGMQAQACARRREFVAIGGIGFIAVYNTDTHQWRTRGLSEGLIEIMPRSNEEWGIRAIDMRKYPNHGQMMAVGWKRIPGGEPEGLVLASPDAGESWHEMPLEGDWPLLEGLILQDTPYLVGTGGMLAGFAHDTRKWHRIKYPGVDDHPTITGYYGRGNRVWFGRSDGTLMARYGDRLGSTTSRFWHAVPVGCVQVS